MCEMIEISYTNLKTERTHPVSMHIFLFFPGPLLLDKRHIQPNNKAV